MFLIWTLNRVWVLTPRWISLACGNPGPLFSSGENWMKIERRAQRAIYLLTRTQMRRAQAAPDAACFFASDSALFLSLPHSQKRERV